MDGSDEPFRHAFGFGPNLSLDHLLLLYIPYRRAVSKFSTRIRARCHEELSRACTRTRSGNTTWHDTTGGRPSSSCSPQPDRRGSSSNRPTKTPTITMQTVPDEHYCTTVHINLPSYGVTRMCYLHLDVWRQAGGIRKKLGTTLLL
jgi:hypothetical protein